MLRIEDLEGLLLLQASLRGTDARDTTGPIALDTGAGYLALDAELARILGIADSVRSPGAIEVADRALPRLTIGTIEMDQVGPVLTIDADIVRRVSDRPVLGLLGQQPLANRALWLDYGGQILALIPVQAGGDSGERRRGEAGARSEPDAEAHLDPARDRSMDKSPAATRIRQSRAALAGVLSRGAKAVPFRLAGDGKILVRARVSDPNPPRYSRDLALIVDTGATKCVLFEDSLADLVPGAARWRALRGLSAPTLTGTSEARIAMVPAIELESDGEPARCERVDVAVMRSDLAGALSRVVGTTVHGLLGASFLRRYRVIIDYPHRVLWLEPAGSRRGQRRWEYCHVGIQIERREGALRVVAVASGTPAERAGIRVDDQLTAIDGQPVGGLEITTVTRRLEGPPGTRISLTMRRGDVERTLAMVRRRLL